MRNLAVAEAVRLRAELSTSLRILTNSATRNGRNQPTPRPTGQIVLANASRTLGPQPSLRGLRRPQINNRQGKTFDAIVGHLMVGVTMLYGDADGASSDDRVFLRQAVLHAPAKEDADVVPLDSIAADQRPLRPRTRMQAQVRVVVAVTVFDNHVVTN